MEILCYNFKYIVIILKTIKTIQCKLVRMFRTKQELTYLINTCLFWNTEAALPLCMVTGILLLFFQMTMFRRDTDPVLPDTCIPHVTPRQLRKPIHVAQSHQRRPSAPVPCTFTKHPTRAPSSPPCPCRIATAGVKPARKLHPVPSTVLPRLAPYAIGAVELHRAYPLSRTTTLHGRSLTC